MLTVTKTGKKNACIIQKVKFNEHVIQDICITDMISRQDVLQKRYQTRYKKSVTQDCLNRADIGLDGTIRAGWGRAPHGIVLNLIRDNLVQKSGQLS